ncbi:MAG: RluA family pseudouridine synthase [Myxococcota bacterium]
MAEHSFLIREGEAGARLDVFLARVLPASRGQVRALLSAGGVRVDGSAVDLGAKGRILVAGQRVGLAEPTLAAASTPEPEADAPLTVLAQGEGWLAVDKPAGTPVHPLAPGERGTLLNALVARHPEVTGIGEGGLRSGVVHRLDVHTSGVLLFATEELRWQALREAFRSHRVQKRYRALVHGRLEGQGKLVLPLAVVRHRPARVGVVEPGDGRSRRTELRWKSLRVFAEHTLVEVAPRTGFLHQIRASLAHLGHPLVGDVAYGAPEGGAARHLLHAARVAVDDVVAESPDAADLADALARLV